MEPNFNVIANDIQYIKRDVQDIKEQLKGGYVTKDEFEPIKRVVYGLVGTVLLSFMGAILALVVK